MYERAQEKINSRQEKYATYVDRKKLDNILHVDGSVYIYFPRMKRMKLAPNWYWPFRIIFRIIQFIELKLKLKIEHLKKYLQETE